MYGDLVLLMNAQSKLGLFLSNFSILNYPVFLGSASAGL